jgi:hypothetical protein
MDIRQKTFECEISETFISIEYTLQTKIFWIVKYYIDPTVADSNLLGIVLSSMISFLKKNEIELLTMTISMEEWEDIKKNTCWEVIKTIESENLIEIKCSIDNTFDCLLDGFVGIYYQ